jgi:hypothetical protein
MTSTGDGDRVLDSSAHLRSRALVSQSASVAAGQYNLGPFPLTIDGTDIKHSREGGCQGCIKRARVDKTGVNTTENETRFYCVLE